MEEEKKKLNFVSNGVAKLPPGFRFEPTDEEIVFEYLKCKVLGLHLPAAVIPEINVFEYDPWDLPGELEEDKYFFCSKKMNVMSRKATACSGYWKSTGEDQQERLILSSTRAADNYRLVGLRKTMSFYKGNMSSSVEIVTEWKMHEYHLMTHYYSSSTDTTKPHHQSLKKHSPLIALGGWSICHVLKKNKCDLICYASMLNKRTRDVGDIDDDDSSNEGLFKLSKIDANGAKCSSASSCCRWPSSGSSVSVKCSSDDTEESSSSSSLH